MSAKAQPILAVRDVRASAQWYAHILGSDEKFNPNARHHELWLRDRDGYIVVLASPGGRGR